MMRKIALSLTVALLAAGCVNGSPRSTDPAVVSKPAAGRPAQANDAGVVRDRLGDRQAIVQYAQERMVESVAAYERGELDRAIWGFREVIGVRPLYVDGHLFLARSYRSRGSVEGAAAALTDAYRLDSTNRDVRLELASLYVETNRHAEALALLEPVRDRLDGEAGALTVLGECLVGVGRDDEAQVYFRRALEIDPGSEAAYRGMMSYHALAGNRRRVQQLMRDVERAGISVERVLLAVGDACWKQGMHARAISFYRESGEWAPYAAEPYGRLGTAFRRLGRTDEALSYFRSGLSYHPEHADLRAGLGEACVDAGRTGEAILHLRKVLQAEPDHATARLALSRAYRTSGDALSAVTELNRALARNPHRPELHQELGLAYRELGEKDLAGAAFARAQQLDPESRFVHAVTAK